MFCWKCGAEAPEGAAACPACGSALGGVASPAVRPAVDVPNYLVQSILLTLFCCMPFGVVAIVYSAMAVGAAGSGDYEAAVRASNQARTWCWVALGLGFVPWLLGLLWIAFMFVVAGAGVAVHG